MYNPSVINSSFSLRNEMDIGAREIPTIVFCINLSISYKVKDVKDD